MMQKHISCLALTSQAFWQDISTVTKVSGSSSVYTTYAFQKQTHKVHTKESLGSGYTYVAFLLLTENFNQTD